MISRTIALMAEVDYGGRERAGGDDDPGSDGEVDGGERGSLLESRIRLGSRLREIRRQQRLSLEQVEAASDGALPTSLLGAYERGERTMTVLRLETIARFYRVPIDQLLPRPERRRPATGDEPGPDAASGRPALVIDLVQLAPLTGEPYVMLRRFCDSIREQRNDQISELLTLRADDRRVVAAVLDIALDRLDEEMSLHGLIARRAPNGALRRAPARGLHLVRDD
jgi:transcriptional regulator with XRE-family HTH domain